MQPIGDNVIVEIITETDKFTDEVAQRTGLIYQATEKTVQGEPYNGRVYAMGPDIEDPEYSIGDNVVFSIQEIFQGFRYDDKKLVRVKHHEIIGKITEGAS